MGGEELCPPKSTKHQPPMFRVRALIPLPSHCIDEHLHIYLHQGHPCCLGMACPRNITKSPWTLTLATGSEISQGKYPDGCTGVPAYSAYGLKALVLSTLTPGGIAMGQKSACEDPPEIQSQDHFPFWTHLEAWIHSSYSSNVISGSGSSRR